ncbi:MAG: hypothetical protein J7520_13685 [Dokdonella sp.]|nr:hypothetical protein [Dokdonella sp.]
MRWSLLRSRTIALCAGLFCSSVFALDGSPDTGFGDAGIAYLVPDQVEAISFSPTAAIELPDGKLLFAGSRYKTGERPYQPEIRGMLVQLNADGSVDSGFGNSAIPGLFVLPSVVDGQRMQEVQAIERLADGSVLMVGNAYGDYIPRGFVAKVGPDGQLDAGFGVGGVAAMRDLLRLHSIGIDGKGRVLAAGEQVEGTLVTSAVVRLHPEGGLDETFGDGGVTLIPWSGGAGLWGELHTLAVTPDDGVVVAGYYEIPGEWEHYGYDYAVARLDSAGRFDPGFAGTGWRVFHDPTDASTVNSISRIAPMPDGRIAFAGYHTSGENQTSLVLGMLAADGSTDESFGDAATPGYFKPQPAPDAQTMTPTALVVQDDGKLLVGATYYVEGDHKQLFYAVRASADGRLDTAFADAGVVLADVAPTGVNSDLGAIALQHDGRIILAGRSLRTPDWSLGDLAVMRLLNTLAPTDRLFANGFDSD